MFLKGFNLVSVVDPMTYGACRFGRVWCTGANGKLTMMLSATIANVTPAAKITGTRFFGCAAILSGHISSQTSAQTHVANDEKSPCLY